LSTFAGAKASQDISSKNVGRGMAERQAGDVADRLTNNGNTGAEA
jgi:hypothetical protein